MEPAAAVSRRVVERHRALGLQFITFLPQDNVVAGQQGTDTDPVSVNVAGLTVLLRLPASEFFSHVLFNEQLHAMVDSHLRHRLKWHEAALAPAGAADTHHHAAALRELDQCVLRLLAREVEQQRAYDSCRGTEAALSDALYDGWVVDVPKLLDVCSLCGPPHARVAARICDAAFRLQPKYWADLAQCMETVPRVRCAGHAGRGGCGSALTAGVARRCWLSCARGWTPPRSPFQPPWMSFATYWMSQARCARCWPPAPALRWRLWATWPRQPLQVRAA